MLTVDKTGPTYGVELIAELPMPDTRWVQVMASRTDLEACCAAEVPEAARVAHAYEVAIEHIHRLRAEVAALKVQAPTFDLPDDVLADLQLRAAVTGVTTEHMASLMIGYGLAQSRPEVIDA